jgi:DNA-binding MarR family transcriptional regulator
VAARYVVLTTTTTETKAMTKLTKGEAAIIKALGWGNPAVRLDPLRKSARLTMRGVRLVVDRLEARNLLVITRDNGVFVELSLAGHRLKEREAL